MIQIYTVSGQLIGTEEVLQGINAFDLNQGLYIVNLIDRNGYLISSPQKFVIIGG